MLIECHIRRIRNEKPGSDISLDGQPYRFEPNAEVTGGDPLAHVCEVLNDEHIAKLLSINECYTEFGDALAPTPPPPEPVYEEIPDEPSETDELQVEEDLDIELQMCETIVGMNVRDASEQLGVLSDKALEQLVTMEKAGSARSTLLNAIQDELDARANEETSGVAHPAGYEDGSGD